MGRLWGRLYAGTRNHRKIRILRERHPAMWTAWYVLIELAIECDDDGWIYVAPGRPYTYKELAREVGIGRADKAEGFIKELVSLGLATHKDELGICLNGFMNRNYTSDSSTERVRKYRDRLKNQEPEGENETFQKRDGDVSVTAILQNRTEQNKTEQKVRTDESKNDSPSPSPSPSLPIFSCKFFTIDQEYQDKLLKKFQALSPEILAEEFSKMEDWLFDNPGRHKYKASGALKDPRRFINRWVSKVVVPPGSAFRQAPAPANTTPLLPARPDCAACDGTGLVYSERVGEQGEKRVASQICGCRRGEDTGTKKRVPVVPNQDCPTCHGQGIDRTNGKPKPCACLKPKEKAA